MGRVRVYTEYNQTIRGNRGTAHMIRQGRQGTVAIQAELHHAVLSRRQLGVTHVVTYAVQQTDRRTDATGSRHRTIDGRFTLPHLVVVSAVPESVRRITGPHR